MWVWEGKEMCAYARVCIEGESVWFKDSILWV